MANIARLGVVLGLDSAKFTQGIEDAKRELAAFAKSAEMYAKIGAASFVATTVEAMRFADELSDVAKANDVAIESILKLQHALQQSGGEAGNAAKLMNSFNSFVDKAATGNFEAQQSFKKMGVSLKDLKDLGIEDLFKKVASGLSEIDDPITRNAKAVEIFGRAIKGVDLVGFNENLQEAHPLTQQQINSITDLADAWDLLGKKVHDAHVAFAGFFGTPIKNAIDYVTELTAAVGRLGFAFRGMGETLSAYASIGMALMKRDFEGALAIFKDLTRAQQLMAEQAKTGVDYWREKEPGWETKKADTGPKREVKPGVDKEADRIQHLINKLKEKQAAEKLAYDTRQAMFEIDMAGLNMRKEDVDLAKELYQIDSKRKVMIDEIQRTEKISQADKDKLIAAENEIARAAERQAKARTEIIKSMQEKTLVQGFDQQMNKFFREAPTQMQIGAQMFDAVVNNMGNALDNFVRNGKFSFKDLTRSILQDLLVIQMRAQMIGIFRGMFAASNVGGVTGPDNIDVGGGFNPAGRAGGGDVVGGMPYYVGERGPELFVPQTSGSIVPNHSLAMAGVGGGQTVNYNGPFIQSMNAIDTQTGVQFLVKNKQTIWAANQSAQRALPASR